MPIEGYSHYDDNEKWWDFDRRVPAIMPGEYRIISSDISAGSKQKVIVHCLRDDSGGEVYRADADVADEVIKRAQQQDLGTHALLHTKGNMIGEVNDTKFEFHAVHRPDKFGRQILRTVLWHRPSTNS